MMDPFQLIQSSIAGFLSAVSYFDGAYVTVTRPHFLPDGTAVDSPYIQTQIENALNGITQRNGKTGAAIVVLMPGLNNWEHLGKSKKERVTISVRAIENSLLNNATGGTGISAEAYALAIKNYLHHWTAGGGFKLYPVEGSTVVPLSDDPVTYEVNFFAYQVSDADEHVERPTVAVATGLATLTCPTSGAAIYYTLDETFPWDDGATSHLYSVPFAVTSGQILSVCAFKDGVLPSDLIIGPIT